MRIVFIGTTKISISTAKTLIDEGHEVVFVEKEREEIDRFSEEMDCGFIHGDGSAPDILKEVGPEQTDYLFCLTSDDQDNIIAGLVGRSLGFEKIFIKIENFAYEHICAELDLENIIVPTRTISRYLVDIVKGSDSSELSNVIRDQARFFIFSAGEDEKGMEVGDLKLPKKAKVVCFYREKKFNIAESTTVLEEGDEIVVIAHSDSLESLKDAWPSKK